MATAKPITFASLPVGAVFQVCDGRVDEGSSWMILMKVNDHASKVMRVEAVASQLVIPGDFIVRDSGFRGLT